MNPAALTRVVVAPAQDSPVSASRDVSPTQSQILLRSVSSSNQSSPSNDVRATLITPMLEKILERADYPHWGINE